MFAATAKLPDGRGPGLGKDSRQPRGPPMPSSVRLRCLASVQASGKHKGMTDTRGRGGCAADGRGSERALRARQGGAAPGPVGG